MIQIKPPIKTAAALCGTQKKDSNAEYRYTKHCSAISCQDGTLLYHTLTSELLLIGKDEDIDSTRGRLMKSWFLVPEDFDECKQADEVRRIAKLLCPRKGEKTHFTIFTTTDCNARCFYCYELGLRRYPMAAETARDVGAYIVRTCGGKKVSLSWFGGEPLLNQEPIEIISDLLREKGIPFEAIITSNGFYLDETTAHKAVNNWHIKHAQITIDGTEEKYNKTKAYIDRGEQSPFRRVLQNISYALDAGMKVTIRLNMDRANAEDLFSVVEEIAHRFGARDGLSVHVALLKKYAGDIHAFASDDDALFYRDRLNERLKELRYLPDSVFRPRLSTNQCMADNDSSEVILPDGRLEKCEHLDEKEVFGSIYTDSRDNEIIDSWKETIRFPECTKCALYPKCVALKKCPAWKDGCSNFRQISQLRIMESQIQDYYLNWRNKTGEPEYEEDDELYAGGSQW